MTKLAVQMAQFTAQVRQLVTRLGHQRTAEILYHAADKVIAEGHANNTLPGPAPRSAPDHVWMESFRGIGILLVAVLLISLIVRGLNALF
jgi:hypothetical protein